MRAWLYWPGVVCIWMMLLVSLSMGSARELAFFCIISLVAVVYLLHLAAYRRDMGLIEYLRYLRAVLR